MGNVRLLMMNELQPRRILIIDDEPDIREFIGYNLMRKGYQVFTATDGLSGLDVAWQCRPHLIILDILMPVMNGYETCRQLRAKAEFDQTRILFLSALNESYAKDLGIQLEADGYINKPIRLELLLRRVDDWVKRAG
jgi:two-component system, OmpR family, alkaline phosphatase synthesis response regulator PhoP